MTTANSRNRSLPGRAADRDLNKLVYHFDSTRPWQYFVRGPPIASSVEKGKRKLTSSHKLQKIYVSKDKRKIIRRKNAAFNDVNSLVLTCCRNGCLLRQGLFQARTLIRDQRNMVYQKSYNEQNYLFARLMEIRVTIGGKRRVTYSIPTLGKVCKTAFRKCYGLSRNKIEVLLKKINPDSPCIQQDQRGQRAPRKFLPFVKNRVIDFICSHEASESHYRRARTNAKKYFDSKISMRQMWSKFLTENPDLKTTSLRRQNKGPVLSFSSFRNIFNSELKEMLSFRKSRQDTCQTCDQNTNDVNEEKRNIGPRRSEEEIRRLINERESHLRESETRFASLKYDVTILVTKV